MSRRYNAPTGIRNVLALALLGGTMLTAMFGADTRSEYVHVEQDRQQETAAQLIGNTALEQYWRSQAITDLATATHSLDVTEIITWITVGLGAATGMAQSVVDDRLKHGQ